MSDKSISIKILAILTLFQGLTLSVILNEILWLLLLETKIQLKEIRGVYY